MPNFNRKALEISVKVCLGGCDAPPPPPPPLPPPPSVDHSPSPFIIFMFCCLAATFSSVCYIATLKVCRAFRSRARMRSHGNTNQIHQDFIHEEQGSIVFHPIWLINTIGLDQSAIDSIKVIEYRKGDRLIDGTDCAVCLGEFQDEESLRLLPNCSHAFHVSCIDTWLRSHKTCPVCRAPVVNNTTSSRLESNPIEEEIPIGNMGNQSRRAQNPQEIERNDESLEHICLFVDGSSSGVRVQSDLTDRRPQELLQSVRRSVSMDSFAAVSSQEKKPNGLQKSTKRRGLTSSISICSIG